MQKTKTTRQVSGVGSSVLKKEAKSFARYLVRQEPSRQVIARYTEALAHNPPSISATDIHLLEFIRKHPWSLGCIEAGLALRQPHSEVRRRLYIMLAILESSPDHTAAFLPQERSAWYIVPLALAGLRAVGKALVGVIMVGVVR
ncbi:MAG TPA: hypothetical protein VK694_02645 [Verrucomicrobiae bacterium]|nr:hypothetical protein [Verrucomicrobiae bacterium]